MSATATAAFSVNRAVVRISFLLESKTNPRQVFDSRTLAELTESIRDRGVIQPLLVRSMGQFSYEIIDGARRYRAALAAGLAEVPVMVYEGITDNEALELQQIANLQREDLSPIEEGQGYRSLIVEHGYTVEEIGIKVGKPAAYIQGRLKLTDLVQKGQERLAAGEIGLGVALRMAALQPEDQTRALATPWCLQSVKEFKQWMSQAVLLDLQKAPWDKASADLLPAAGSCQACVKRTGSAPLLWEEEVKSGDTCTDPKCFEAKQAAFVEIQAAAKPEAVRVAGSWSPGQKGVLGKQQYSVLTAKEAKTDPDAEEALVVEGEGAGSTIWIKRGKGNSGAFQRSPQEQAAERKRKLEEKIKRVAGDRAVAEIVRRIEDDGEGGGRKLSELTRFVAERLWDRAWNDLKRVIVRRRGLDAKTGADELSKSIAKMNQGQLAALLVELGLGAYNGYGEEQIDTIGGLLKVDVAGITAAVREELKPKEKTKAAKKAPAKKAAAKKAPAKKAPAKKAAARKKKG